MCRAIGPTGGSFATVFPKPDVDTPYTGSMETFNKKSTFGRDGTLREHPHADAKFRDQLNRQLFVDSAVFKYDEIKSLFRP